MGFSIFQNWEFSIKSDDKKQEEAEREKGKKGDFRAGVGARCIVPLGREENYFLLIIMVVLIGRVGFKQEF